MFVTGFVIFLSTILLLIKLPRRWMLRLLHYEIAIDVAVSVVVLAIHWGTFSGVIAATFAGLLTSLATSAAKRAFGHIHGGQLLPGLGHAARGGSPMKAAIGFLIQLAVEAGLIAAFGALKYTGRRWRRRRR